MGQEIKPLHCFICENCKIENVFYRENFLYWWDGKTYYCSFCKTKKIVEK